MDKANVQAAFAAAGLSRLVKDIDLVAKTSIRLVPTAADESTLKVGTSKLGGIPDLPSGVTWPEWKGMPQSCIAQIWLEDVRSYDTDRLLPEKGMLWFFYDAQQETFGADPADRGGWRVIFMDSNLDKLQRTPAPAKLPASSQFKSCSLSFTSELTLSQQPKLEIPNFDWTEAEQKQYETLLSTFPNPVARATPHHRMLGFADIIQDDMRLECQLASHGVTDVNDPRIAELSKGAKDWLLLLQVDTDERIGMRWETAGMLYYGITGTDLRAHHFENSWLVLQSE